MPIASKVATTLATYLYLSDATTETLDLLADAGPREETLAYISQADRRFGFNAAAVALRETAYAIGDHPETALPRWTACLAAVEASFSVTELLPLQREAVAR